MNIKMMTGAYALAAVLSASAGMITTEVDPSCEGMGTVTAVGKVVAAGKTQAIKATAAKGYVFTGWYTNDVPATLATDYRNPSSTFVATEEDVTLTAKFGTPKEDGLSFSFTGVFESLDPNADLEPIDVSAYVGSVSLPTLTFTGLPAGLKFDSKTLTITGRPTKPGYSWVTISGKNASGYQYSQTVQAFVDEITGDRITGSGDDFYVGEKLTEDDGCVPEDFFSFYEENLTAITYSGWPTGLSVKNGYLVGTCSKAGSFAVTATAKYSTDVEGNVKATTEKATATFVVSENSAYDYDCDLSVFDYLQVGAEIENAPVKFGSFVGDASTGTGVTSVSGLPTGLALTKDVYTEEVITEDVTNYVKVTDYYISGTPTKAGLYKLATKVKVYDEESENLVTVSCVDEVIVSATESYYVEAVAAADSESLATGTVTGSAVVQPGTKVTLKATASKGSVFAGWYSSEDEALTEAGVDYRNPSRSFTAGLYDDTTTYWAAKFVTAAEDASVEIIGLDGVTDADSGTKLEIAYQVESKSLPTVKVTGLPNGFTTSIAADGNYVIAYDPETAKKVPTPGVYTVKVTATNVSKASCSATFTIQVANWTSERITVDDNYGPYTPGEEIDPIDWTSLVDFDAGETVKISGLPKGLSYTDKAIAETRSAPAREAHSVYGNPTVPGYYTVTIAAKVVASVTTNAQGKITKTFANETATTTIHVDDFPELSVIVDDEAAAAGCKVTGTGAYIQGTKVTLKAVAAKGWVFAGWGNLDESVSLLESLNPTLAVVTTSDPSEYSALFIRLAEDYLSVDDFTEDFTNALNVAVENTTAILDLVYTASLPNLSVAGLPAGIKFDSKTCLLSGKPTKSGIYYATVTAKNAGGYSFVRVLKMVILNADGSEPEEPEEINTAGIDMDPLVDEEITTGVWYDPEDSMYEGVLFEVPDGDYPVKKVAVKGLPTGMSADCGVYDEDVGGGYFLLGGVPSKPGRYTVTVDVTYTKGTAKAVKTFTVYDGGSMYVDASSFDDLLGTVTGSGVYAAGATVKLTAKASKGCVFTGWYEESSESEGEYYEFALLPEIAGVDHRTASVSFPLVNGWMPSVVTGCFEESGDDDILEIVFEDDEDEEEVFTWEIENLDEDAETYFYIESDSLPKLTVSKLPVGVSVDAVEGCVSYDSSYAAKAVPGVYSVKFTAQNQSYSTNKLKVEKTIKIVVPNKTSEVISCDPSIDAYPISIGMPVGDLFADIYVDDGYSMSVSGLPAGITYNAATGTFSGAPTKTGDFTVTLTAKQSGYDTETATITVSVAALPDWLVGTFEGYADDYGRWEEPMTEEGILDDPQWHSIFRFSLSVTSAGKTMMKLMTPSDNVSFVGEIKEINEDNAVIEVADEEVELTVYANGSVSGMSSVLIDEDGDAELEEFSAILAGKLPTTFDRLGAVTCTITNSTMGVNGEITLKFKSAGTVTTTYKDLTGVGMATGKNTFASFASVISSAITAEGEVWTLSVPVCYEDKDELEVSAELVFVVLDPETAPIVELDQEATRVCHDEEGL